MAEPAPIEPPESMPDLPNASDPVLPATAGPGASPGEEQAAAAAASARAARKLSRRQWVAPLGKAPPTPWWFRVAAALAPYVLLLLVAAPFAAYYDVTLLKPGAPRLMWARPWYLGLLATLPVLAVAGFHLRRRRMPALLYSRVDDLAAVKQGLMPHLAHLPRVLRIVAVALLAVALARPQLESADVIEVEGIDIVLALDVSMSMQDQDIKPDRIGAAKAVLKRFIQRRKSDRLGLVLFGKEAFTQCPLTLDYRALTGLLEEVRLGLVDGSRTAIGDALATALNRLRRSDARSKVIILLTDGENNAGSISPQQAARFAQNLGVKVFTVLMGSDIEQPSDPGLPMLPRQMQATHPVNPRLLEEIAGQTGGTPYLATDSAALEQRFQSILDELDRSHIKDQKGRPREIYMLFLSPALALLMLEVLLALTRFRRFP